MNRIVSLIDGDEIAVRASFASQHKWYYVCRDGNWLEKCQYKKQADQVCKLNDEFFIQPCMQYETEEYAVDNMRQAMRVLLSDTKCDENMVFVSGKNNFRYDVATLKPYKGGRREKGKHFDMLKDLLLTEYFAVEADGMEADDYLAMYQVLNLYARDGYESIICTQDKDLNMVEGRHYNPRTREFYEITREEGIKNFYVQLLTGDDAVDNIPGIKGIGRIKALKILDRCKDEREMYLAIRQVYQESTDPLYEGHDIDEVLMEIGNLLWMKRSLESVWTIPK